eukprot:4443140-Alexandrium_andersonii.AAC.1
MRDGPPRRPRCQACCLQRGPGRGRGIGARWLDGQLPSVLPDVQRRPARDAFPLPPLHGAHPAPWAGRAAARGRRNGHHQPPA